MVTASVADIGKSVEFRQKSYDRPGFGRFIAGDKSGRNIKHRTFNRKPEFLQQTGQTLESLEFLMAELGREMPHPRPNPAPRPQPRRR